MSGTHPTLLGMDVENDEILREPPAAGTELETLIGSLERQRRTFAWKCSGLDAAGLRATTAATTMTLGGLLKHLALVEDDYFTFKLLGADPGPPLNTVDWESDPDWEWRTAGEDSPEQLYAVWEQAVARARANLARALTDGDPGQQANFTWPNGESPSIRRLLVDMIEEYARHTGHADLLREAVDGLVGEDPPQPHDGCMRHGPYVVVEDDSYPGVATTLWLLTRRDTHRPDRVIHSLGELTGAVGASRQGSVLCMRRTSPRRRRPPVRGAVGARTRITRRLGGDSPSRSGRLVIVHAASPIPSPRPRSTSPASGARQAFEDSGFEESTHPTPRRVVMRSDFEDALARRRVHMARGADRRGRAGGCLAASAHDPMARAFGPDSVAISRDTLRAAVRLAEHRIPARSSMPAWDFGSPARPDGGR